MKNCFGLAKNEEQANRIVDRLMSSGFSNEDISVLYPDKNKNLRSEREYARYEERPTEFETRAPKYETSSSPNPNRRTMRNIEENTKAPEGGVTGALTGGVLGGSLGLLAGIGSLSIPGLGPFIAAGPILSALSGSAIGGSLGLLVGSLVGAGIPEYEAKKFEAGLKSGNILISVQTENDSELHRASDVMKKEGAKDVSTSREKTRSSI